VTYRSACAALTAGRGPTCAALTACRRHKVALCTSAQHTNKYSYVPMQGAQLWRNDFHVFSRRSTLSGRVPRKRVRVASREAVQRRACADANIQFRKSRSAVTMRCKTCDKAAYTTSRRTTPELCCQSFGHHRARASCLKLRRQIGLCTHLQLCSIHAIRLPDGFVQRFRLLAA
jgi:hypothetical protein